MKNLCYYLPEGVTSVELCSSSHPSDCHDAALMLVSEHRDACSDFVLVRMPRVTNSALRVNVYPGCANKRYTIIKRDRNRPTHTWRCANIATTQDLVDLLRTSFPSSETDAAAKLLFERTVQIL